MKLLRFGDDRIGVLKNGDRVVDVSGTIDYRVEKGPQRAMEEVIGNFDALRFRFEALVNDNEGVPLDSVRLLSPIPRPGKVLAAFVNYLDSPTRKKESLVIDFFYKSPDLVGPEGTIELEDIPPVVVWQPEAEIAFVMGSDAKNVTESNAYDHIFGYVPFFDISARGMNRRTQFIPKGQDTYAVCGPWITTKDEVPDPHALRVQSWVNEGTRQDYSTEHMAHPIPEQVAWLTQYIQLHPADVITTGTYHPGLGPLNDGDVLEIEIERLGRARFFAKGKGPRKDAEFMPGQTQMPTGGGFTRV
jgi:2-keto-4-pentenoate hydratase/2-oxohepta-3-ene-1,7-dioic acid hydratase in catechol pathway